VTRVAIVTGAARGIGAATVHRLARDGWSVVAVDRCANDADVPYPLGTREELDAIVEARGGAVVPLIGDVRDPETSREAVRMATGAFGALHAAIAAAAVIRGGRPFWEAEADELDLLWAVDVQSVAHLARAAVPALLAEPEPRHGRFIAVASTAAHTGLPLLTSYCAVKHAVLGLVRGLADDLAGTGVTAMAVSPGSTNTAMLEATAALYGLENASELRRHQVVGRLLEPDEIAAAIVWLAGEESSALTGDAVRVDGGFTG
jgi:SDR family mycofactocin-dependent oxidoreductase